MLGDARFEDGRHGCLTTNVNEDFISLICVVLSFGVELFYEMKKWTGGVWCQGAYHSTTPYQLQGKDWADFNNDPNKIPQLFIPKEAKKGLLGFPL